MIMHDGVGLDHLLNFVPPIRFLIVELGPFRTAAVGLVVAVIIGEGDMLGGGHLEELSCGRGAWRHT